MDRYSIEHVLALIRVRHCLRSNFAVCKYLGFSSQLVSHWVKRRSYPDTKNCQLLAEAACIDGDALMAYNQALRAATPEEKAVWERVLRRLEKTAHERPASADFAAPFAPIFRAREPAMGRVSA